MTSELTLPLLELPKRKKNKNTPLKRIRKKCLDCSGGSSKEVRLCNIPTCPLYIFRSGKSLRKKRILNEEEKETLRKRFKANINPNTRN